MPEQLSDVQTVASESLSQLLAVQTSIPEDEGTQPSQLLELVDAVERLLKTRELVDSELSARSLACSGSLSPLADPAY